MGTWCGAGAHRAVAHQRAPLTTLLRLCRAGGHARFWDARFSFEMSLDGAALADATPGTPHCPPARARFGQEFRGENNNSSASSPTYLDHRDYQSGTNTIPGSLFETNRNSG